MANPPTESQPTAKPRVRAPLANQVPIRTPMEGEDRPRVRSTSPRSVPESKVLTRMQPIEVTAKSLDEAKKSAAEKLGVDVSRIEASVIEQTKGLFGKTSIRISASVIEAPAEPAAKEPVKGRKPAAKKEAAKEVKEPTPEPEPVAAAATDGKKPRGGRGAKKAEPTESPAEPVEAQEAESEVVATQEDAERLADVLRGLVASADLNVTVKPGGVNGRYVNLQLDGKDAAFLVGKHG